MRRHRLEMLRSFYLEQLREHWAIAGILGCNVIVVLASAISRGQTRQALAYLAAVAISFVVIDALSFAQGAKAPLIPVRNPRFESLALIGFWVIALAWLAGRFVFNNLPGQGLLRLASLVIGLGSVFAILPALFLFSRRYSPADLGLRLRGIAIALPVLAIFAGITFAFSRQSITWSGIWKEEGSLLAIVQTAISACLPEEFFRFAWQTRIGAWMKKPEAGWLIASIAWAMLHGPIDYSQSHSAPEVALGVINIVPLGLLWGYLARRTGSFVPSMLLHGLNFWGLQNS
jgi:membrane protease YdiL (CAAX protease family)